MSELQQVQLYEYMSSAHQGIDREAGVIRGVKILGKESPGNHRTYSDQAMQDAVQLYEGVTVCVDHDPKNPNKRSVRDGFGSLKNTRLQGDAIYGDLHYLKEHPDCNLILERTERMSNKFGLSHAAFGLELPSKNGMSTIERIQRVHSVDLVNNPATNKNLFEQPEEEAVDPAAQMKDAFKQMVVAVLDEELDMKGMLAKIKNILKAQDKLMSDNGDEKAEAPSEEKTEESGETKNQPPAEEKKMSEQAETKLTETLTQVAGRLERLEKRERAGTILLEQGFTWSDVDQEKEKLLFEQEDDAALRALVDSWPKPTLQLSRARTGPLYEGPNQTKIDRPVGGKHFAAAVR